MSQFSKHFILAYPQNPTASFTVSKMTTAAKSKGRTSRFNGERGDFLDAMAGEFMTSSDRGSFYSLAATRYVKKFGYSVYGESPDLSKMEPEAKQAELERRKKFLPWLRTVRFPRCSPDSY